MTKTRLHDKIRKEPKKRLFVIVLYNNYLLFLGQKK